MNWRVEAAKYALDAPVKCEWQIRTRSASLFVDCRQQSNAVRPHMGLNYLTPPEFRTQHQPLATIHNRAVFQE